MKPRLAKIEQTILAYPTPIRQHIYKDKVEFNRELTTRILSMRDSSPGLRRSNVGGWHSDSQLLQNLGPELGGGLAQMFMESVRATVLAMAELDQPLPDQVLIEAWANINMKG